jgi:glutamyl-tRNA reductase
MRNLGMIGCTYRRGGQENIERFTLDSDSVFDLHEHCGFVESMYLATCNRVEVIFVGDGVTPVAEYRRRMYEFFSPQHHDGTKNSDTPSEMKWLHAYGGEGAAEHLFCVAAALDSMKLGEKQILGQVKTAYRRATELGLIGARLRLLVEEAIKTARSVQNNTSLGQGAVSMLTLALGSIEEKLGSTPGRFVMVGAGEMTVKAAESLRHKNQVELLFVNRTLYKAEALANRFDGVALSLDDFIGNVPEFDAMITSTSAPEPIFDDRFFDSVGNSNPLVVDMAIPRDTDIAAARMKGIEVVDIDQLGRLAEQNRATRVEEAAEARVIVDESLEEVRRRMVDRDMGPLLKSLRDRYHYTAEKGLERLFGKRLVEISEDDREHIRRWTNTLVNRLTHLPTSGLRHLAFDHGMEAVESFLQGVGHEFTDLAEEAKFRARRSQGEWRRTPR